VRVFGFGFFLALALVLVSRIPFFAALHRLHMLVFLVLVPLAFIKFSGRRLSDYNIGLGDVGLGLKYSAVLLLFALPFMYYGSTLPEFRGYYPLWDSERDSFTSFLYYEVFVMGVVMFYTEFFYRGFLLRSLVDETRYGNLVQSLIYMYVHLGKPGLEVWWSLPAGFVFGEVDLKCKSILPSFLMHWLSSMLFNAMILYL
jgi:membrane protease YdiL (CAAX protease family)